MTFTRERRTKVLVAVCAATLCLLVPAVRGHRRRRGRRRADRGPGLGRAAGQLRQVNASNVINAFKWGFCGTYESHLPNTDPIEPPGH